MADARTIPSSAAPTISEPAALAFASLRARIGGYVVDMVIFSAIAMVVVTMAFFILLLRSDFGTGDPSDADYYTVLAIIGAGTPIVWSILNLALLSWRGQTGGQYVAGLRTIGEDGAPLSRSGLFGWWFIGNPLLYSWPMGAVAGFPLSVILALAVSVISAVITFFVIALCIILPVVALITAALNPQNRAAHDRVAGVVVVPAA